MLWAQVAALAAMAIAVDARMVPQHKNLVKRQSLQSVPAVTVGGAQTTADASVADAEETTPTTTPVTTTPATTTTPTTTSPTTAGKATSPDPLLPPTTSSLTTTTSPTTSATTAAATETSATEEEAASASDQVATTIITSTQSDQSESASAAAATESKKDDDDSSSGVGKKTLIIVISVASAVGLVAAIWTILRKWKFSPSRKFEERLNPIDWNTNGSTEKLTRADSTGSTPSLQRQNSWGSARGAAMSEVSGYNRPTGASAVGTGFASAAPGYPPGYSVAPPPPPVANYGYGMPAAPYPSQQSLNSAHEYSSVTRQASQVNGGRYGEGFR